MKLYTINKNVLFYNNYKKACDTGIIYNQLNYDWLKAVRMLHLKSRLPLFSIWYTKEFKHSDYNKIKEIIIFDTVLTIPAANYIKKHYPQLRVIYWFWNHIYNKSNLEQLSDNIEKWSYDIEDCKKYSLKHNTQFYFKELVSQKDNHYSNEHDFFFVGAEKGRKSEIDKMSELIERNNLSKFFSITGNNRKDRKYKWLSYDKVIDYIVRSRCIVDLVPSAQKGLTIRPLEALFFKKKLITNFSNIKQYDFYHPENIFVVDVDSEDKLVSFINTDFNMQVGKYQEKYDFNSWLSRF